MNPISAYCSVAKGTEIKFSWSGPCVGQVKREFVEVATFSGSTVSTVLGSFEDGLTGVSGQERKVASRRERAARRKGFCYRHVAVRGASEMYVNPPTYRLTGYCSFGAKARRPETTLNNPFEPSSRTTLAIWTL